MYEGLSSVQRVVPMASSGAGSLLRCFVRRDSGGERAVAKFRLFLGGEHNDADSCKFLMAALLNSRSASFSLALCLVREDWCKLSSKRWCW